MLLEHHSVVAFDRNRAKSGAAQPVSHDAPWSARKTLAFILLTCGGFWLAIGLAIYAVLLHW